MTRIRLVHDSHSGGVLGYGIQGHAGYGQAGRDIVCAAVSFLATTCANALESAAGQKPSVHQGPDTLQVTILPAQRTAQTDTIFAVFIQGMTDLAAQYGKHVHFEP